MTRQEAITLAFEIRKNPEGHDFSSYLYSAVGLVKREKDAGTAFAVMELVSAIEEANGGNLSDFCKKRIEIIKKESVKPMGRLLEKMVDAIEYDNFVQTVPEEFCR